jgi:hypothetical protein
MVCQGRPTRPSPFSVWLGLRGDKEGFPAAAAGFPDCMNCGVTDVLDLLDDAGRLAVHG